MAQFYNVDRARNLLLLAITAVYSSFLSHDHASAQTSPVHEWLFENNLNDTSGSGNNGVGFFDSYVPGVFGGQGIFFNDGPGSFGDGIDNESANNLPIGGGDTWTINIWGRFATPLDPLSYIAGFGKDDDADTTAESVDSGFDFVDAGRTRGLISFGNTNGASNGDGGVDDGVPNNNFYLWGFNTDADSGAAYLADDQWHMYTATYDGANLNFYVDADLQGSAAVTYRSAAPQVHVGNPAVPGWTDGGQAFTGALDQFRIYDQALDAGQVGGLFINDNPDDPFNPLPTLTVSRDTGAVVLNNNSSADIELLGYTIKSPSGGLDPAVWSTIAGRFDSAGDGTIDSDDNWIVLTRTAKEFSVELSEGVPGTNGGVIAQGKVIDFGNAWIKNPVEDITIDLLLNDGQGTIQSVTASFSGNGGNFYEVGDFDANGTIDVADYVRFRAALDADTSAFLDVQAYLGGDINGDGRKDIVDFNQFAQIYDAANGSGSFRAMLASIPEPNTLSLLMLAALATAYTRRRQVHALATRAQPANLSAVLICSWSLSMSGQVHAQLPAANKGYYNLNGTAAESSGSNNNIDLNLVGGAGFGSSFHPGLGAAISLDGVDDAAIGQNFDRIVGNDLTVVAWVFADTNDGVWESIVKNWGDLIPGQFHFGLGVAANNFLNNFYSDGSGGPQSLESPTDLPVGRWVHTTFVLDSTLGQHRFYVDGNEVANGPYGGTLAQSGTAGVRATGLGIGGKPNDDGSGATPGFGFWDGLIDEVGIFESVLSAAEIGTIITDAQMGVQLDGTTVPFISLEVDRGTGQVTLKNSTSGPVDINSFEVASPNGNLAAGNLDSIAGAPGFPMGNGTGNGWEADGANDSTQVLQHYLTGSSLFATGDTSIGSIFAGTSETDEDLVFRYGAPGGAVITSLISYVGEYGAGIPGDFDSDRDVDGNDFLEWQRTDGAVGGLTNWENNYGATSNGSLAATQVPEPATTIGAMLFIYGSMVLRLRGIVRTPFM